MARGLPQEVAKRAKQEVSLDHVFHFECKRCGRCCFQCEIVLTPYDLLRLCEGLEITTGEFLSRYGQITLGAESGLPVCWLDFERVQRWRGGDGRFAPCPFLALEGDRFACGVYAFRPSCCRSFPVFRMAAAGGEPKFYLQEVSCPASETEREHRVGEWITREVLAPYHRGNDAFLSQVLTLSRAKREWPREFPMEFLELLCGLWYDFSRVREVETMRERYELAMQGAELLIDTVLTLTRRKDRKDEMQAVRGDADPRGDPAGENLGNGRAHPSSGGDGPP
jgi:Fe-S-cluster containining protein